MIEIFDNMGHLNSPSDDEVLEKLAVKRRDECKHEYPVAVEVGSWAGHSTLILAKSGFVVFAVDHWCGTEGDQLYPLAKALGPGACYGTFCHNMGTLLLSTVFPLRGTSELMAVTWPKDKLIDLCFIDADHSYESAYRDIRYWTPHMRPGGLLIGHDYSQFFPGVIQAVKETGPYELMGQTIWYRRIEW
jgi:hypothetical protein